MIEIEILATFSKESSFIVHQGKRSVGWDSGVGVKNLEQETLRINKTILFNFL